MARDPVARVLAAYPIVHHALRQRDVVDPSGGGGGGGAGAAGAPGRLSIHQATVLAHLDRVASVTLTELAGRIGVALPTMSLLIDRLVRGGLVRRERDPADGRRVALRLTGAGARAAASRSLLDPDRVRALLDVLTAEERSIGVDGLVTLARAARRLGATAAPQRKD